MTPYWMKSAVGVGISRLPETFLIIIVGIFGIFIGGFLGSKLFK